MTEVKQDEALKALAPIVGESTYVDVLGQKVQLTVDIVRKLICPSATPFEIAAFIATSRALGANPFLRQIYLIKYSAEEPASVVVGRDFYLHIAHSQPNFLGLESGTLCVKPRRSATWDVVTQQLKQLYTVASQVEGEIPQALKEQLTLAREQINKALAGGDECEVVEVQGEIVPPGAKLFGGWARVYIKDERLPEGKRVVEARVMLSEYDRGRALWKQCPATMIVKVAEAHALRKAFPLRFGGAYMAEELGVSSEEF
ncbi:MAG: RecT family recombinase [Thermofilaceae archaeon]